MATQQTEQAGSAQVAQVQAADSTVASGSIAGNDTAGAAAGTVPAGAPVVAPKGFRLALQQMLQGWQGAVPGSSAMSSSVGTLTQASVVGQLQEYLGQFQALDTRTTAQKQARVQVKAQLTEMRQYYAVLRAALRSFFGEQSPQLEQFGLKPKKATPPLKSEQLAVRAAKVRATRTLRGTKGSVQKAGIKAGPMAISIGPVAAQVASTAPGPAQSPTTVSQTSAEPTVSAVGSPPAGK